MTQRNMKLGMVITMHQDLEKSVEFYQKLGLKLNFHMKNQWAEFALQDLKFGLCPTEQKYEGLIRTGIVLEVQEDLHVLYKTLKEEGIEFVNEPVDAPHGIMVGFKDPSGNVLDLYQPTPEKMKQFVEETKAKEAAEKAKAAADKSAQS